MIAARITVHMSLPLDPRRKSRSRNMFKNLEFERIQFQLLEIYSRSRDIF